MHAADVLTEAWLAEVLEDSLKMGWSARDGARAIMNALEGGLVQLPQSGGQIVAPSTKAVMMQFRRATKAVEDALASVRGLPTCATWFSADTDYAIHEGDLEILLAALSPQRLDAKEGRCGKCRGSGHVQRGDSGECDACGGTGDDTSEAPTQRLDAATVEREGSFACPICGQDTPHHHTPEVVDAYQNKGSRK